MKLVNLAIAKDGNLKGVILFIDLENSFQVISEDSNLTLKEMMYLVVGQFLKCKYYSPTDVFQILKEIMRIVKQINFNHGRIN